MNAMHHTMLTLRAEVERLLRGLHRIPDATVITDSTHLGNDVPIAKPILASLLPPVASKTDPDDIGLDTLDSVEFIMSVEDHYGIQITEAEEDACQRLGQLADLIATKTNVTKENPNAS